MAEKDKKKVDGKKVDESKVEIKSPKIKEIEEEDYSDVPTLEELLFGSDSEDIGVEDVSEEEIEFLRSQGRFSGEEGVLSSGQTQEIPEVEDLEESLEGVSVKSNDKDSVQGNFYAGAKNDFYSNSSGEVYSANRSGGEEDLYSQGSPYESSGGYDAGNVGYAMNENSGENGGRVGEIENRERRSVLETGVGTKKTNENPVNEYYQPSNKKQEY